MIPILYGENEPKFNSQGYGGLSEAQSCRVFWQANGMYELEMRYPAIGRRFQELAQRRLILASVGPDEAEQPFRIYRITKPLRGMCTIYARHIAYDLMGYTVRPFSADSLAAAVQQLNSGAVTTSHGFEIATDKASSASMAINTPRSVWSMLGGQRGSLLDVFGGEWDFDRFKATLRKRLGEDLGVTVRYGVNLQTFEQDENIAKTWTAVQPFWLSSDGSQCVMLPEELISTGTFTYTRILVLDLSAEWQEPPTVEQLRARTQRYISANQVGVPDVALDISFLPLDQTEEYKGYTFLNKIHKGDTVTVEFPIAYDPDTGEVIATVSTNARAVEYIWLPMEDKYESVRLGRVKSNFATALAQVQAQVSAMQQSTPLADVVYPDDAVPETPTAGVTALVDSENSLRMFINGTEVIPVLDDLGDLTWPDLTLAVDAAGDATLKEA